VIQMHAIETALAKQIYNTPLYMTNSIIKHLVLHIENNNNHKYGTDNIPNE